jgi:4,5-DOPA dioxygenase extradiol
MSSALRLPVLFIGHGSPMNAIEDNLWSRGFRELGKMLPQPKAILAVSAHWYVPGTLLTANEHPETIHDFGGFPEALYELTYLAPGDPNLARRVVQLLGENRASVSYDWGIDHGAWTVLRYLFPRADCPVIQLSIHSRVPEASHLELGGKLAPLREEGVLILGSGNIVHNLHDAFARYRSGDVTTPDWAIEFDKRIAAALEAHDHGPLVRALEDATGRHAHPTPDHYLPLLYAAGASDSQDTVTFPVTGFDMGSLSMRAVMFS